MKGTLEQRTLKSRILEGNPLGDPSERILRLYLPPGYRDAGPLPVVYFLHAYGNSGGSWFNASGFGPSVPERIDDLISEGTIPPCIAVFVDGWTSVGGSQWVNSDALGRYRDHVVREVVREVDRTLPTRAEASGRAVIGHSSGGYGALIMGRFHPEVFGHLASHSGDAYFEYCYLPSLPVAAGAFLKAGGVEPWYQGFRERARHRKLLREDHEVVSMLAMAMAYSPRKGEPFNAELPFELETGRMRMDVWSRWLVNDPVRFVPKYVDVFRRLKTVFLDCGTRDEANLRWGTRMLAEDLRAGGAEVFHEEHEDGHTGIAYRYERSLAVLVPRMVASSGDGEAEASDAGGSDPSEEPEGEA
ncbi:MAG TPA: alpha/beta hydrolase-fold protein [Myxococcaceae bacterium]|nr:alpha/beta hydrolase-fold protein [Myxococcaceae bacterium]